MRVFIAGIDGYLGWTLAQYLTDRGHEVAGADLFLRRQWVEEMNSTSATPISNIETRLNAFKENFGSKPMFWEGDLCEYDFVEKCFS
jgi:UDP-sulfoquinovose synthase